ncbi:MAG TPA: hypothetical protein VIL36_06135 [Acidimicrobiales bacterium]
MARVRRIGFRIEPGFHPDRPWVAVLVDGEDLIGRATGYQGFDPDDVLGPDSPLLPTDPPRRVAVYRCSCGEAGCGCAACIISERDGVVRWYDFRDYVGVYHRPTVPRAPRDEDGETHNLPTLAFDAAQYRAAVVTSGADRAWETRERRVARLLRDHLDTHRDAIAAAGYGLGWVSPDHRRGRAGWEAGFGVELRAGGDQRIEHVVAPADLGDEEAAERMAAELLGRLRE